MAIMDAHLRISELETALTLIRDTPCSQVNDSESLRHTIKLIQHIATEALRRGNLIT